jgi:hypothetical protein
VLPGARTRLSRRALAGLAASGLALSAFGAPPATSAAAQTAATPTTSGSLAVKGMTYDTGTYYPRWDIVTRQVWDAERVRREFATIHDELHCTAIELFGSDIDRLAEGAAIAHEQGLAVWLQPRQFDAEPDALLEQLGAVAREAERLRGEGADITLNVGVELTLFSDGIIPGATFEERIPTLLDTVDQLPTYNERLNDLLARANTAARELFAGPLTYGSGEWESVDWSDFDIVGVDLYQDQYNRDTYVERLRSYHQFGKPVVITEVGCCSYEGAEDAGGSGYAIIDWDKDPPELIGEYVRSEQVQADYIGSLLDLYQEEGVHGAFVYTFVEPGQTYSPDPRYDLDMASFGIVKIFPEGTGKGYEESGYWEPKVAFHEIADRFGVD